MGTASCRIWANGDPNKEQPLSMTWFYCSLFNGSVYDSIFVELGIILPVQLLHIVKYTSTILKSDTSHFIRVTTHIAVWLYALLVYSSKKKNCFPKEVKDNNYMNVSFEMLQLCILTKLKHIPDQILTAPFHLGLSWPHPGNQAQHQLQAC